jgi:uncharacterized protein YbaP (TraB family)
MKQFFRFLLAASAAFFSCQPAQAQSKQGKIDNALLWKISGKGISTPSYLFGTIHVICEDDYLWTDKMKAALASSKALCMELNLGDPNLMTDAAAKMMDLSGKMISDYFSPDQFKQLSNYVTDSLHQNMDLMQFMKPVGFYMLLATMGGGISCPNPVSYEIKLMEAANAQQKPMSGLETLDEQMSMLESIPTDSIIHQILMIVQGLGNEDSELGTMISAYKKQDLNQLNQLVAASTDHSLNSGIFIDNRNKKWVPVIESKMKQQATFFAVGSGHLYGLIGLLRQKGYTVEAIK